METRKIIEEASKPKGTGLVYRKVDNYQKAYKLEPFEIPQEWLDAADFNSEGFMESE